MSRPVRMTGRSVSDVINQAIEENRPGERLLYLLACLVFFVGIVVLGMGAYRGEGLVSAAGTVVTVMFYPAMRMARKIREQNMAIRLLEIPLNNSRTAEEAASVLRDFFQATMPSKKERRPS